MADVYMIGNAHLDPVWLWRWQDGFSEILATYRSALDRLYEFPDTKFTSACDTWAHDKKYLGSQCGVFTACQFELTEQGPLRAAIRVTSQSDGSSLQRTYMVTAGSNQVLVYTKVDIHGQHKTLKFTFPMTEETVTSQIPFGTVTRQGYTGEEPCQKWFASGNLCIANDCKYGYDTYDGQMRMTVLHKSHCLIKQFLYPLPTTA